MLDLVVVIYFVQAQLRLRTFDTTAAACKFAETQKDATVYVEVGDKFKKMKCEEPNDKNNAIKSTS